MELQADLYSVGSCLQILPYKVPVCAFQLLLGTASSFPQSIVLFKFTLGFPRYCKRTYHCLFLALDPEFPLQIVLFMERAFTDTEPFVLFYFICRLLYVVTITGRL